MRKVKMDVDTDIDGHLVQQFLAMGTQDKEVLITQFQHLIGNQLNPATCEFFLDMNNWNLPAAVGCYYDYEPAVEIPCMAFVKDTTVGEGESVRPGANFTKTWRIKNTGTKIWPPGCSLKHIHGQRLGSTERVMVDALSPGDECDVVVKMVSPINPGIYEGRWRMTSPTGTLFGETIYVIVQVSEDGLLDITQEMSRCGGDLGQVQQLHGTSTYNPFSSSKICDSQTWTMPYSLNNDFNLNNQTAAHRPETLSRSVLQQSNGRVNEGKEDEEMS